MVRQGFLFFLIVALFFTFSEQAQAQCDDSVAWVEGAPAATFLTNFRRLPTMSLTCRVHFEKITNRRQGNNVYARTETRALSYDYICTALVEFRTSGGQSLERPIACTIPSGGFECAFDSSGLDIPDGYSPVLVKSNPDKVSEWMMSSNYGCIEKPNGGAKITWGTCRSPTPVVSSISVFREYSCQR